MNSTFFLFIWSGDARLFCRSQWDVSHMRESGVRGGVNLVQSSFSHSLVYNRVSKYMGHSEDSIAQANPTKSGHQA